MGRALAVALALAAGAAAADPPSAYAARRAAGLAFRDWRLACLGPDCVVRTGVGGGDGSEVLAMTADRADGTEGAGALRLRTPLPLYLPDGVRLGLGDAPLRPIPWRTCDAAGCEAETPLDADLIAALERERSAEVTLTLVEGVTVRLPVSLLGFTAALAALAERAPTSTGVTRP